MLELVYTTVAMMNMQVSGVNVSKSVYLNYTKQRFKFIHQFNICISVVLCQDGDVRLRRGRNATEGRVEICFNNQWGTICDASSSWSNSDANVVCKQLGFSPTGKQLMHTLNWYDLVCYAQIGPIPKSCLPDQFW